MANQRMTYHVNFNFTSKIAIERTQAIADINFVKFSMSCADDAVIVTGSKSLAPAPGVNKSEPNKVEENPKTDEKTAVKKADVKPRNDEEKQCCNLL